MFCTTFLKSCLKYGQYKDTGCMCVDCKVSRELVKNGKDKKVIHVYKNKVMSIGKGKGKGMGMVIGLMISGIKKC